MGLMSEGLIKAKRPGVIYDHPVINSSNAIGANVLWLADPVRWAKDTNQATPSIPSAAAFTLGEGIVKAGSDPWPSIEYPALDLASVTANQAFTVWLEMNLISVEAWGAILLLDNGTYNDSLCIVRSGATINLAAFYPLDNYSEVPGQYFTGTSRLAFTYGGSRVRFYRNGLQTYSSASRPAIDPIVSSATEFLRGAFGTFKRGFIANRALSDAEVASLESNFDQLLLNP